MASMMLVFALSLRNLAPQTPPHQQSITRTFWQKYQKEWQLQRPKQKQFASNRSKTKTKEPLTMMERVGLVYVLHHSLTILNHIKAVEYSSNYVAANVVQVRK